ncbi:MAG TPA: hypothetical protein VLK33_19395 [Terriglobales bacterium]|nr:hypothetical protein [Terriglobales bacterium]
MAFGISLAWGKVSSYAEATVSAQRKVDHIEANGALAHPDPKPTELNEQEINAYIASGKIQLPEGVKSVHLVGVNGAVTGTSRVDFDKIKGVARSSNPLLSMFSGVHDVEVQAHAHGSNGRGIVHVDSLMLDGAEIPHFLLELFVEKYLKPKYPGVGMDTQVALPGKIDTATIGTHILTVVQK